MDADEARRLATDRLREVADPTEPLRLSADPPTGYPWCWVFRYNTERWYRTGALTDAVVAGPLVVNKADGTVWQAPSAPPVERWLNEYAASHGLAPVPVPAPGSPW
jgi:hypothetical protein